MVDIPKVSLEKLADAKEQVAVDDLSAGEESLDDVFYDLMSSTGPKAKCSTWR